MYTTFKHLQLFKISSDLSKKHLKLTSLPLSSSPYQSIFSYSSPSIQNQLSQTPSGSYKKFIQHSKTTTLTYTTFKHLQLFKISSDLSQTHLKLTSLPLSSSPYQNIFSYSSPSIQDPLTKNPREPIQKLIRHSKITTLTYTTFKHPQLFQISSDLSKEHLKLTSLPLFSSIYKNVVSYSPPSIQNPLSQTSREPIEKLTQYPKTTTLTCHFQTSITYSF